jgi:glycine/D-amino acid oxidase-like deaminating enzyme
MPNPNGSPAQAGDVAPPVPNNTCTNVVSEFASSVWRSGLQRPVESVGQIVGLKTDNVQTDDHLQGAMKIANIAGNATGQLLDMVALQVGLSKIMGAGKATAGATALDGLAARTIALNATTGLVYGGVLTPVEQGQSQWSRLGNAAVDAGTFSILGAAGSKIASTLGDGVFAPAAAKLADGSTAKLAQFAAGIGDRAIVNIGAGAAAGLANTQLDAWTHGKVVADGSDYVNNTLGWAFGNAVLGEGTHQVSNGLSFARGRFASDNANPAGGGGVVDTPPATHSDQPNPPLHSDGSTDTVTRPADATDLVTPPGGPRPKPDLDLRGLKEIAETGDEDRVRKLVNLYYPQLQKAFPLPGEIEDPETYVKYLMDPEMKWEMEQLLGPIQGGLQYQVLHVGGDQINNAGWLEHIWVADHVRESGYGSELLAHVQDRVAAKGGDITFWEWNNPDKMSPEEIEEDQKGGITTQDRVNYWARRGASVAVVPSTGEIAPYAQPGMDGQEEVPYLSLAFTKPGGLEGQTISKSDYLKTLVAAHGTITDVDTDPTVRAYKDALNAVPDQELKFVKLEDYIKQRTEALAQSGTSADQTRIDRWTGDDFQIGPRKMIDIAEAPANPEVAKALGFQASSRSPWLRTADLSKRFPTLTGETTADTVVVGSGVVGQQIADRLAGMGQRVIMLERGKVGSGTSSMMGAMNTFVPDTGFEVMRDSYGATDFATMMRRSMAARESTAELGRRYGDYQPFDSFNVGYSDNNEGIAAEARIAQEFDPNVRFITGGDAERIFPLARSVAIFPREGNLNPRKLLLGMANSGRYATFEDSPVLGVAQARDGAGADVFTPEGTVHARKVIFATNTPVTPFSYLNDHLVPVQTFANVADVGAHMPGNYFDAPDVTAEKVPFSYWRQFNLPGFKPDETLVGGTAHMLDTETATRYEPNLPIVTRRLFGADGRDQMTAMIFTSYADGAPIYAVHPQYPFLSMATGGGGTGLVGGALLAQAAQSEASGNVDELLSPSRFRN